MVKKIMQGIIKLFQQLGKFSPRFFSRLKVFQQVLIIIGILVLALFVEGLTGIASLNASFGTAERLFNDGTNNFSALTSVQREMYTVRNDYIINLSKISPIEPSATGLSLAVEGMAAIKDATTQGLIADMNQDVANVEKILTEPINQANYDRLDNALEMINQKSVTIRGRVNQIASDTMNESRSTLGHSITISLLILVVSILLGGGLGLVITSSVARPLNVMMEAANALAAGDLTLKDIKVEGCYEASEAVRRLNNAVTNLRDLVSGINEQATILFRSSRELNEAATDSGKASNEVARAMEELTRAATEQTNQINQAVNTVNQLAELVRTVSLETEKIAAASQQMAGFARTGQDVSAKVATEINELYTSTKEVSDVITELNKSSEEITKFTSVIRGIAEQTTLLALNAAIEAARAGIHGKGFSVVAEETGKLAEQSKEAAKLIDNLVTQMRTRSGHAVQAMQKGIAKVEEGRILSEEAKVTFGDIFRLLENIHYQIDSVAASAKEMALKNEGMITAVSTIATISEESLASTEQVSATAQQQSATTEEVTALAENLTSVADKLKEAVTAFEV
jgi:methyl-accepting chemotaxis protein